MKIADLSPEAHGTLLALQGLREIRLRDEVVAEELVEHGYAEIVNGKLRATEDGLSLRPFEETPLDS
jgi:hypothetical protein